MNLNNFNKIVILKYPGLHDYQITESDQIVQPTVKIWLHCEFYENYKINVVH